MSYHHRFLYLLAIAASASAIVALAASPASAHTTKSASSPVSLQSGAQVVPISGLPAGVYLVHSSTPLRAPIHSATSIERRDCSDGQDPMWVNLYLESGGILCYGYKGTLSSINDGPATELCSGNNTGNTVTNVDGEQSYFAYSPANSNTPSWWWYQTDDGEIIPWYLREIHNVSWSGDAEC
jgi:hypothetical protein